MRSRNCWWPAKVSIVVWCKVAAGFVALSVTAAPALSYAQTDRAAEIVETAMVCNVGSISNQARSSLIASGWKDATPAMFGGSAASVTGATQYRKGNDSALITASGKDTNCEFDFADVSAKLSESVVAKLDSSFGFHSSDKSGALVWRRGGDAYYLLSQAPQTLTIFWIPEQEQKAAQQ